MRLGIIGLPLSGKTTVFNALTRSDVPPTTATTGKLETHTAIVDVPDERVDRLSALFKPRKTIYAKVTYTDFANLEQDVGKTGLTGPLRNQIATTDAFVLVIRGFESSVSPHPLGSINPQRDLDLLHNDFMLADLVTVESLDGGFSWSRPRRWNIHAEPSATCRLDDGRALLVYGYRKPPFGVRGRVLSPEIDDLDEAEEFIIRDDSPVIDVGYPWIAPLGGNRFFIIYYLSRSDVPGAGGIEGSIVQF